MELVFFRSSFPSAPGGDIYHWEEVDTTFQIHRKGKYVIKIIASAKNAEQNNSTDDDDLRISIDDYRLGKYEIHDEKISWKGFGTASSWDGASLKGGIKTIYFFLELKKGEHKLEFYADKTPVLKKIEIFELEEGKKFKIEKQKPSENIETNKKGVPWMSFIFFGVKPEDFSITSICQSAKQKGSTDGDNLKVVVNGKILKNPLALNSKKYKNFYFSGDLNKGKSSSLKIPSENFDFLEDSVELWYDKSPQLSINIDLYEGIEKWVRFVSDKSIETYFRSFVLALCLFFRLVDWKYCYSFLKNSLKDYPENKFFSEKSLLVKILKNDQAYQKLLDILRQQIKNNILEGQVYLGDKEKNLDVAFESTSDLRYSLHGLKKIEFTAIKSKKDEYKVNFILFDVYDFSKITYRLKDVYKNYIIFANNQLDAAEVKNVVKNFEIQISISEVITIE